MHGKRTIALTAIAALTCIAAGCGSSAVVSGTVTYEGQAVQKGSIAFLPVNGVGPSTGGLIVNGQYRVEHLSPGKKLVQIIGVRAVRFARSSEEMDRLAKVAAARGDTTGIIERADVVPANAEGNNLTINLKPGRQTMDFHLKRPPTP